MIFLCVILLPNDRVHAILAAIGKITKPTPVTDKIFEVDVAPMITFESIDYNFVFRVLYFLYLFFDLLFLSLKYAIISFLLVIWVLKLFTSFIFFSNPCSRSIFFF